MPVTEVITQRDTREEGVFEDQFGRPFLIVWEKKTGDPTGQIDRAHFRDEKGKETSWDDPLRVPQKYFRIPRTKYGMKEVGKLFVDLPQFGKDQKEALREWTQSLWRWADIEYPSQKPTPSKMEQDPLLLRRTGPKPWPSVDVIAIACKGSADKLARQFLGLDPLGPEAKLMLGSPDDSDVIAQHIASNEDGPPGTYREFVGWAIRKGEAKTIAEAAKLWKLSQEQEPATA